MSIQRMDRHYIVVGDDPIPWDAAEPVKVRAEKPIVLKLKRARSDESAAHMARHFVAAHYSRPTDVFAYHLDGDRRLSGGLVYYGRVLSATLAGWDSNQTEVARDHLAVEVLNVEPIHIDRPPAS